MSNKLGMESRVYKLSLEGRGVKIKGLSPFSATW